MKNFKYLIGLFLVAMTIGCSQDDNSTDFIKDATAPANLSAIFTITQDNSGKVTIRPNGEGVTSYDVYFGDGTVEAATIGSGMTVTHVYAEGNYDVRIVAMNVNGLTTEYTQPLSVSFLAPENLQVTVTPQTGNPYKINVTAKADLETYFEVFFGEMTPDVGIQFNEGQSAFHVYSAVGTYTITVVAYSGGAATTTYTQQVTVFDPILLPVNFESSTLNYAFGDFGGAVSSVVNNPSVGADNPSAKVGRLFKTAGSEVWAGISLALDQPIDFSTLTSISIKTYSSVAGAVVKLKLEKLDNSNISTELDAVTTVANGWETLTYTFNGINNANNYQRVVLFYDFGNNGTGANFYFDDIKQTSAVPVVSLPLTFENSALTYTFTSFGGADTNVTNNPDQTGINTSTKVAKLTKNIGAQSYAGSFIELAQPIDFSSLHKIKMKVWSPQAGIIVKIKLENLGNSNINTEIDANTTISNGWEELTFNFTGIVNANNYQRVVVFFDFNNAGTGLNYYFDDIKLSN